MSGPCRRVLSFVVLRCSETLGEAGVHAHFVEEETEAQAGRGTGTCPHSSGGAETSLPQTSCSVLRTWTTLTIGRTCSQTCLGWWWGAEFICKSLKEVTFPIVAVCWQLVSSSEETQRLTHRLTLLPQINHGGQISLQCQDS